MKAASVKEIKDELKTRSSKELLELCLRLSRFKKENKELLTYLLFESYDEMAFVESVKRDMDEQFVEVNRKSYYYIRKSIRKILSTTKKYIRYSQKKETEVDLLIYFCLKLKSFKPSINRSAALQNIYIRQIELIKKTLKQLHEDLQFDYEADMEELLDKN
jgi:predicted nucleotidyltransferase